MFFGKSKVKTQGDYKISDYFTDISAVIMRDGELESFLTCNATYFGTGRDGERLVNAPMHDREGVQLLASQLKEGVQIPALKLNKDGELAFNLDLCANEFFSLPSFNEDDFELAAYSNGVQLATICKCNTGYVELFVLHPSVDNSKRVKAQSLKAGTLPFYNSHFGDAKYVCVKSKQEIEDTFKRFTLFNFNYLFNRKGYPNWDGKLYRCDSPVPVGSITESRELLDTLHELDIYNRRKLKLSESLDMRVDELHDYLGPNCEAYLKKFNLDDDRFQAELKRLIVVTGAKNLAELENEISAFI